MNENFIWSEAYRPHTIEDCILPEYLKTTFKSMVVTGDVPNMMFVGTPGIGKTTVAKALLEEIGADVMDINGSLEGNIDKLRTDVANFASTVSFTSSRKYVIIDEADNMTNAMQLALRGFIETYSKNCGFILTCNFKNRIIEALHSRCPPIEFKIAKEDRAKIALQMLKRASEILNTNNIPFEKKALAEVINKFFPDFRRVINELQTYSKSGSIDTGILANMAVENIKELITHIKNKKFTEARKWVSENTDFDSNVFFRLLFDTSNAYVTPQSIPQLVLILSEYQYKQAFVADAEINMLACIIEIMADVEFK